MGRNARTKARPLPARTIDEVIEAFPSYRQSLLSTMDNCALSARFELEGSPFNNSAQSRGIIGHRFAAEYVRTLQRTGEQLMPTEEAMQILYETARQQDVPDADLVVLPMRERRLLRMAALKLCSVPLNMNRLIAVEERLFTTVAYQNRHGQKIERQISGQPDLLIADPPDGIIGLDWKFSLAAPAEQPKTLEGTPEQPNAQGDHLHVSYEGYFQQRFYALLVLDNYPTIQRVVFREFYPLVGESREASIPREALEHIREEMALIVEYLDRALIEGSKSEAWRPSPGQHCGFCRRPTSCPIEDEARMIEGGITSDAQAARFAAVFVLTDKVRSFTLKALKARVDATEGRPIPVRDAKGRHEMRWGTDSSGKRRFKLHVPDASDRGADDPQLAEAFAEAARRKAAA